MSLFRIRVNLMALAVAMLCSCSSSRPAPQEPSKTPLPQASSRQWQGEAFDRVVGYRFADAPEWRSVLRMDPPRVDMVYLQKMKRNEAVLSEAQIDRLMAAIFGTHRSASPSLCYEPHHIFIFFAKDRPVGAFEFCLRCQQYRAWPKGDMNVNESYVKLAALCRELHLGVKPPER